MRFRHGRRFRKPTGCGHAVRLPISRVVRVRLNTKKSSALGGLGSILAIGGCSAALLVPNEYARLVLLATLLAVAPVVRLGIAAQRTIDVDFSSVAEQERRAFLFRNTISFIIGLMGLGAYGPASSPRHEMRESALGSWRC